QRRREHHRGHHRHPDADVPAERPEVRAGPGVHPAHPLDGDEPRDESRSENERAREQRATAGASVRGGVDDAHGRAYSNALSTTVGSCAPVRRSLPWWTYAIELCPFSISNSIGPCATRRLASAVSAS